MLSREQQGACWGKDKAESSETNCFPNCLTYKAVTIFQTINERPKSEEFLVSLQSMNVELKLICVVEKCPKVIW